MLALCEGHRPAARLAGVQLFCDRRLPAGVACVPGLTAMGVGLPGRREETLAGLPDADGARILAAADRNGGRAEWGLRELIPGRLHAEPAVLLERLLPAIIKLLNELMAATPVEDLSGVSLTPENTHHRGIGTALSGSANDLASAGNSGSEWEYHQ
jgi:hypothetical protein